MYRMPLVVSLCWSLACSAPADELQHLPERAIGDLRLAEGLEAGLFAAEPQLLSPTNIAIDAQGRVWVCEVTNYRGHVSDDPRAGGDRILILTDQDGDGRADRTQVFYQGRDVDSAQGIAVLGNRVIVTAPPNVLVFLDDDGDDRADRSEFLFRQTGKPQDDHSAHAFVFGPDGRLYWNMGNHGYAVHDRDGRLARNRQGWPVATRDGHRYFRDVPESTTPWQGGMVLRCELDGSHVEVLGHNFRNNYELAVDAYGNIWQADNDDDGNRGCRVNYILAGGNYGYREEWTGAHWRERRVGQHEDLAHRHWHQNDPGVVPNVVHTGAGAPAGMTIYEGKLLPAEYRGQPLVCDAGAGTLRLVQTRPSGAGFHGQVKDVMRTTTNRWVRPADVAVAPDGSVFISDWYDPVLGWNRQADRSRGRIIRIAPQGHRYQWTPSAYRSNKDAIESLDSPNADVRFQAWQHWSAKGVQAEEALVQTLVNVGASASLRARVLWLLARLPQRGAEHLGWAMNQADTNLRLVAVRAAAQRGQALCELLTQAAEDPDPRVRAECAIQLSLLPVDEAVPLWVTLAVQHDGQDRWYLEALGIGARSRWDACLGALVHRVGTSHLTNTPGGRDLVWRSRSGSTPQWLAKILIELPQGQSPHRYLRALSLQSPGRQRDAAWKAIYRHWAQPENPHPQRDVVLGHTLLRLPVDPEEAADPQRTNMVRALSDQADFVALAKKFGVMGFQSELWAFAESQANRGLAAEAVSALLDAGAVEEVRHRLRNLPADTRSRWMEVLGATLRRDAEQLLVEQLTSEQASISSRLAAVRALASTNHGAGRLLEMAENGKLRRVLAEEAGRTLSRSLNVVQRNRAASLLPMPRAKEEQVIPQMTELLTFLGDPQRGKQVFVAATCVKCHQMHGQGEEFGPDLSQIGDKLSKRGLYEAILDPSSGIAKGYEHYVLVTREGVMFSTLKLSESPRELTVRIQGVGVRTFPRSQIEQFTLQDHSVMPVDLMQLMTVDELVDLVAYLAAQRASETSNSRDSP